MTDKYVSELAIVTELLDAALVAISVLPGYPGSDWWTARARVMGALQNELADQVGLRASFNGGSFVVRIAGLSASGTSGFEAALKNWQAAARRRIGQ